MADTIVLRFAQEELVYLLRALSIGTFPGLQTQPLGNLDADHQALALAVADRTLRARRVVAWDSQEDRHVDPIVAGVIRDCVQSDYTLLLDMLRADKVRLRYLYAFGKHSVIEQCMPEPGVHQLVAIVAEEIPERLFTLLALEEERSSQEKQASTLTTTPSNLNETIRIWASEASLKTDDDLASIVQSPQVLQHLALWSGAPDETSNREPDETLTVIQGDNGLFLLLKEKGSTSHLSLIPATALLIKEYIVKLLRPTMEVTLRSLN